MEATRNFIPEGDPLSTNVITTRPHLSESGYHVDKLDWKGKNVSKKLVGY